LQYTHKEATAGSGAGGGAVGACAALSVAASGGSLVWGKVAERAGAIVVGVQVTIPHSANAARMAVTTPTKACFGRERILMAAS
jgi:hypothetical protein